MLEQVGARCFTQCLRESTFPVDWKLAKLVLLPKPGKPEGEPSSYRPICLLSELGKLFERVLAERLRAHLENCEGLSEEQFGFRKGKSTVDAILRVRESVEAATGEGRVALAISLDVANAFNSLPWSIIKRELQERGVPHYLSRIIDSYLSDRRLCYVGKGGRLRLDRVTCGVPQGSVLGPILWNVGYDRVLRADLPPGCETVGYADDTIIIVVGDSPQEVIRRADVCAAIVVGEIKSLGLLVSPHKTEIMLFGGPRGVPRGGVWVDGVVVPIGASIRYLGLVLDAGWTFRDHFSRLLTRADGMVAALSRLMPNVGGPGGRRRRLYAGVVQSVLMYGAPVWAEDLGRSRRLRERLASVQRRIALRVISAYRTVSGDAAAILSGLLPGDILAGSYRETYLALRRAREVNPELTARARTEIRKRERRLAVETWRARLVDRAEGSSGARVRDALTPVLAEWLEGVRGGPNFRVTQLITGHGSFGEYLHRIGRVESPACPHCGGGERLGRAYPGGVSRMGRGERAVNGGGWARPKTAHGVGSRRILLQKMGCFGSICGERDWR